MRIVRFKRYTSAGLSAFCYPIPAWSVKCIIAQQMLSIVDSFSAHAVHQLHVRIGIHTGTVVAGVIGRSRFTYDMWGDAVNTASRMESTGLPGKIQVSEEAYKRLYKDFEFEPREIEAKGIGNMRTFLLVGAKDTARE